jgi:hypothetical protein
MFKVAGLVNSQKVPFLSPNVSCMSGTRGFSLSIHRPCRRWWEGGLPLEKTSGVRYTIVCTTYGTNLAILLRKILIVTRDAKKLLNGCS